MVSSQNRGRKAALPSGEPSLTGASQAKEGPAMNRSTHGGRIGIGELKTRGGVWRRPAPSHFPGELDFLRRSFERLGVGRMRTALPVFVFGMSFW